MMTRKGYDNDTRMVVIGGVFERGVGRKQAVKAGVLESYY